MLMKLQILLLLAVVPVSFSYAQSQSFKCTGPTATPGVFQKLEYSKYRPEFIRKFLIDKVFNQTRIVEEYKIHKQRDDFQYIIFQGERTKTKLGVGSRIEFELKVSKNPRLQSELMEKLYLNEEGQGTWSEPNLHELKCEFR